MSETRKKFHEFALKSILFKGRSDIYFCYLKTEKIAHVLSFLRGQGPTEAPGFDALLFDAEQIPQKLVHFVAGEVDLSVLLADIFGLLSGVRLHTTRGLISKENGSILVQEYEHVAEKLAQSSRLSPYLSDQDFSVPLLPLETPTPLLSHGVQGHGLVKDIKGQLSQGHTEGGERESKILEMVLKSKGLSIKDISSVVTGCSEKTIQRELGGLIKRGLIRKQGERRWSLYLPI